VVTHSTSRASLDLLGLAHGLCCWIDYSDPAVDSAGDAVYGAGSGSFQVGPVAHRRMHYLGCLNRGLACVFRCLGHRTYAEFLGTPGGGTPGRHRALKGLSGILSDCTQMQSQLGCTGRHCGVGLCVMSQTRTRQLCSAHSIQETVRL
jgi:hypothetical protein